MIDRYAVIGNPKRMEILNTAVIPAINAVTTQLESISKTVSSPGEYKNFQKFLNKHEMIKLQSEIKSLPFDEAIEANNFFNGIDSAIQNRFNQRAESMEERRVRNKNESIFLPAGLPINQAAPDVIVPDIIIAN